MLQTEGEGVPAFIPQANEFAQQSAELMNGVALANDSNMALSASVWTTNLKRGREFAKRMDGGVVAINDHLYTHGMSDLPWGGPKKSGIGRTQAGCGLMARTVKKVDASRQVLPNALTDNTPIERHLSQTHTSH